MPKTQPLGGKTTMGLGAGLAGQVTLRLLKDVVKLLGFRLSALKRV